MTTLISIKSIKDPLPEYIVNILKKSLKLLLSSSVYGKNLCERIYRETKFHIQLLCFIYSLQGANFSKSDVIKDMFNIDNKMKLHQTIIGPIAKKIWYQKNTLPDTDLGSFFSTCNSRRFTIEDCVHVYIMNVVGHLELS